MAATFRLCAQSSRQHFRAKAGQMFQNGMGRPVMVAAFAWFLFRS
ncbi:hypothetical protein ACVNHC_13675 [Pannonibacter sp. Q-1]|nr:hypothetical protein [Pannonibacter phragmitetus]